MNTPIAIEKCRGTKQLAYLGPVAARLGVTEPQAGLLVESGDKQELQLQATGRRRHGGEQFSRPVLVWHAARQARPRLYSVRYHRPEDVPGLVSTVIDQLIFVVSIPHSEYRDQSALLINQHCCMTFGHASWQRIRL